ncbi:MAG: META domain-containing protein [Rhodoferax sp.]|nr:META domain-containing protein [Rhodoferax sp.]
MNLSSKTATLLFAVLLTACGVAPVQHSFVPETGANLSGGDWVAVAVQGVESVQEPAPRWRWPSAEQVSGSGGCNGFTGRAVVKNGLIQVGPLAATGRLCAGLPPGGQEDLFFRALEKARSVRVEKGELVMQGSAGEVLARFVQLGAVAP